MPWPWKTGEAPIDSGARCGLFELVGTCIMV